MDAVADINAVIDNERAQSLGIRTLPSEFTREGIPSTNLQRILLDTKSGRTEKKRYKPDREFADISYEFFPDLWSTKPASTWDENVFIREIHLGNPDKRIHYANLLVGGIIDKITWIAGKEFVRYIEASSILAFVDVLNFSVNSAFDLALTPGKFDYQNYSKVSPYFLTAIKNQLYNWASENAVLTRVPKDELNKRTVEVISMQNPEAGLLHSKTPNPELATMHKDLQERLPKALEALKKAHPIYFHIITQRYLKGMDLVEIATEMGQTKQNIHTKERSALKLLLKIIETPQFIRAES